MSVDNINIDDPFLALLPERMKTFPKGLFDIFPKFPISNGSIEKGYDELANIISKEMPNGLRVLLVDGYHGVNWSEFISGLDNSLSKYKITPDYISISNVYASEIEINKKIEDFLGGDDPIFGMHFPMSLEYLFDPKRLLDLRIEASIRRGKKAGDITIIYGCGSSLVELYDKLWYIDVPKDYLQERARNAEIKNLGSDKNVSFGSFYKRSYFVEWPALNRIKRQILPYLDRFVDLQNPAEPTSINGNDFREALKELSSTPFRLRPWFYPGPWGGKFMQGHMGLDPEAPNFAWSFEMIVPENGVIIEKNDIPLEFSFDCIMFMYNRNMLGENAANQFKYEWPVRFDYLDTIDGGNLSVQVHPRPDYIRKEFGETYTQDETYYICTAKPNSKVYLGLTEDCNPEEFKIALEDAIATGKELDIEKFVNHEPSKPHDLFLIPNGTVHCSGEGNLVLEISATPYIFTFKIYDYMRRDLEGNLRPINIERGFKNIRFERRKSWVQENLVAKPKVISSGKGWQEVVLYDKPYTFYNINRIEFADEYVMNTNGLAYSTNLVQGEQVEIISENGRVTKLSYLETMLIPAATGELRIINKGKIPVMMVMVYIKPDIGINIPLNDPL
ncbi:MAG TPA: class I mannose-6-phosphate isomerase [Ignavibacteriaceae bacterium]|nr:class I mannose-6-phosphate isomerase [Ignavibacteriaceae bacterium]